MRPYTCLTSFYLPIVFESVSRYVTRAGLDLAIVQPPEYWDFIHELSRPVFSFSFESRGVSETTTSAASVITLLSIDNYGVG